MRKGPGVHPGLRPRHRGAFCPSPAQRGRAGEGQAPVPAKLQPGKRTRAREALFRPSAVPGPQSRHRDRMATAPLLPQAGDAAARARHYQLYSFQYTGLVPSLSLSMRPSPSRSYM